jgi:hypothetical protein
LREEADISGLRHRRQAVVDRHCGGLGGRHHQVLRHRSAEDCKRCGKDGHGSRAEGNDSPAASATGADRSA